MKVHAHLHMASKNAETGDILYTFVLTFPRFILAEVNTHRVASRNTSSSRAIPNHKLRKQVLENPVIPMHIGAAQKGMQAYQEVSGWKRQVGVKVWEWARYPAVGAAWLLDQLGVHKQVSNRLIEPWMWTTQVFSATELDNFFLLRDHDMAEPHFRELARQMRNRVERVKLWLAKMEETGWTAKKLSILGEEAIVQILFPGEWHLPFVGPYAEQTPLSLASATQRSSARCARTSYYDPTTGHESTLARDLELYDRLCGSDPKHLSPLEHPAMALSMSSWKGLEANFRGFQQLRKQLEEEAYQEALEKMVLKED